MIYRLGEYRVDIQGDDYFVAENASVIGLVRLGNNVSVWFNTVIRGDKYSVDVLHTSGELGPVKLVTVWQRGIRSYILRVEIFD